MRIINRGRASGKTAMSIATAYMMGYAIIVNTETQKKHVECVASKMNCTVDVFTFNEYKKSAMHHFFDGVIIDECGEDIIEDALENYIGTKVASVTMTIPMESDSFLFSEKEIEDK